MKVGAHVTIAGGFDKSIEKAHELGVDCIQIFPTSPHIWKVLPHSNEEIKRYKAMREKSRIDPVFFHSVYLISLGSSNNRVYWGSINNLTKSLQLAAEIDCKGVIFHTGSSGDKTLKQVLPQIHKALKEILASSPKESWLVIENSAGAGHTIGKTPRELGQIVKGVKNQRLKICLDSQHIFASGYDLREKSEVNRLFDEIDHEVGLDKLVALHINDSKSECGSNIDRHENLGEGKIGIKGITNFISHKACSKLPLFLETPGFRKKIDKDNVKILRRIVENIHRSRPCWI